MEPAPIFLRAAWRNLLMLNYTVDPAILRPRLPGGCELDEWSGPPCPPSSDRDKNGQSWVSVVGFQFLETRVLGWSIPLHRNFEEVNLRFYVRRRVDGQWRRGVVFVREIVPRAAIACVARRVYGEPYVAMPMRHAVSLPGGDADGRVAYGWRRAGRWEGIAARVSGAASLPSETSHAAFIVEHYWGYTRRADGATLEYQVEHPRWQVRVAHDATLDCDVAALYGPEFAEALAGQPATAFVADGSQVAVRRGRRLA